MKGGEDKEEKKGRRNGKCWKHGRSQIENAGRILPFDELKWPVNVETHS